MRILTEDITKFTFENVVNFCNENVPEGIEIDYKEAMPDKGLSKLFAAFSNTRGGVIILGVTEDRTTGIPSAWEGIYNDAKVVEKVHQNASNVSPIPNYVLHRTNEVNGKIFMLIRIVEGEKPPYFVQNDSVVWVRTGNITNPIDHSKPDHLEFLYTKKTGAEKLRTIYKERCKEVYAKSLLREEKRRVELIEQAKKRGDTSASGYCQQPLGTNVSMCEIFLTPYYPFEPLAPISEIYGKLSEIRGNKNFPDLNMESIPEGLNHFTHAYNGYIANHQLLANGIIYYQNDISDVQEGVKTIYMSYIFKNIHDVLTTSKHLYNIFGYQGMLHLTTVIKDLKEVWFKELTGNGFFTGNRDHNTLLDNYTWLIETSTQTLYNEKEFKELFYQIIKDVYWSLGYREVNINIIDKFIANGKIAFN